MGGGERVASQRLLEPFQTLRLGIRLQLNHAQARFRLLDLEAELFALALDPGHHLLACQ